jgi:alginate O-acetyltransferase complex protein AlgJ
MTREEPSQENRKPDQTLMAIFFPIILAFGFGLHFLRINPQMVSSKKSMMNGEWNHQFEKALNDTSPLAKEAISLWSAFEYKIFSTGRKGVLIGQKGWLFSDEEFHTSTNFQAEIQKKLQYIVEVKKILQSKGIQLLVVPIPAKARVYSELLGRYQVPNSWKSVYSAFLASLRKQGVLTVDALAALETAKKQGFVFLKSDTHWTPLGAKAVAKSIQEVTKSLSLTRVKIIKLASFKKEYSGDLAKFIPLGRYGAIETELLEIPRVEISSTSNSLFGDAPIEVTLVGTSYSANTNFGFASELKAAFSSDVLNLALEGKGSIVPMQVFLKNLPNPLPKLVIWELPERFLPVAW